MFGFLWKKNPEEPILEAIFIVVEFLTEDEKI
jgi:hypothetical protein